VDATFSYLKRSLESGHEGGKTQPHSIIGSTHDEPQESSINKAEPTVDVSVSKKASIAYEMYGYQDTWSSLYGYGTVFDISSVDGESRYFTGGMCGRGEGYQTCDTSTLSPGTYIWRVTGLLDSHKDSIAWNFCSVSGGATTEVLFQIDDKGQCVPLMTTIAGPSFLDHKWYITVSEGQQRQYNSVYNHKSEDQSSGFFTNRMPHNMESNGLLDQSTRVPNHFKKLKSDLLFDSEVSNALQDDEYEYTKDVDTFKNNDERLKDADQLEDRRKENDFTDIVTSNEYRSVFDKVIFTPQSELITIGIIVIGIVITAGVVLNRLINPALLVGSESDTATHANSFTRPRQSSSSAPSDVHTNSIVRRIEHVSLSGMRETRHEDGLQE